MYPQHTNLSHPTSNPPIPTPNFQPTSTDNSTESSPQSSLPCGQRTPAVSTSSSDAPSSQTPPQMFVHPPHQPKIPTHTQHTSPSPHRQHIKMPLKTNANQSSQSSIVGEDQQCVPKSADGTQGSRMNAFASLQLAWSFKKNLSRNSLLFKMQNKRTHTGQMHQQVTEDQTCMPSWRTQRPTEKE